MSCFQGKLEGVDDPHLSPIRAHLNVHIFFSGSPCEHMVSAILFYFCLSRTIVVKKKAVADYHKIPLPPTRDSNLFFPRIRKQSHDSFMSRVLFIRVF